MRNTILLLVICCWMSASAQHCGYDFKTIIVVKVYSERTGDRVVPNLKIRIVDKKGRALDQYIFQQGWHFPFISDAYGAVIPSHLPLKKLFLKIESTYEMNFKEAKIRLHDTDKYQLCDHDNLDYYVPNPDGRVYKPIAVRLKKRK